MDNDDVETDMAVRITALNILSQCSHNTPPEDIVKYGKEIYDFLKESGESGRDTLELLRMQ